MNLAFSTHFKAGSLKGQPTYFVEKIWQSLADDRAADSDFFITGLMYDHYPFSVDAYDMPAKIHTIREYWKTKDGTLSKKQWKPGDLIHPVIYSRTVKHFNFAPIMKCEGIQNITIEHNVEYKHNPWVIIDNNHLCKSEIDTLAVNDGFNSARDFFEHFNKDLTGQIIHWTKFKY